MPNFRLEACRLVARHSPRHQYRGLVVNPVGAGGVGQRSCARRVGDKVVPRLERRVAARSADLVGVLWRALLGDDDVGGPTRPADPIFYDWR